ncbi:MAG: MBL fold metallo-hydrolase [Syntrophomonas sp.]
MNTGKGLAVIELSANLAFGPGVVYPVLIWDDEAVVLIDTGFPGMLAQMRSNIESFGILLERLSHIIMTHHDIDHIGCLKTLVAASGRRVEVMAHIEEKPYIEGELPPVKSAPWDNPGMQDHYREIPEEQRQAIMAVFSRFNTWTAPVDRTINDGEVLPICGGIRVIHTPGHTAGHICLYHQCSKTLIAGDALFLQDGILIPPPPFLNTNYREAHKSIEKLFGLEIEKVVCYHGGLFKIKPGQQLADLVQNAKI